MLISSVYFIIFNGIHNCLMKNLTEVHTLLIYCLQGFCIVGWSIHSVKIEWQGAGLIVCAAKCRWFAWGPAVAISTISYFMKIQNVYLSGDVLLSFSWKEAIWWSSFVCCLFCSFMNKYNDDISDDGGGRYIVAGTPVHGHAQSSVYLCQHTTPQPRPAGSADCGHGPGPQSGGDTSQSPTVQAGLQSTLSPTVDIATAPSYITESDVLPAAEVPASSPGAAAQHSDLPLANIKEKTPMCLINELARFNKVHFWSGSDINFLLAADVVMANSLSTFVGC